MVQLLMYHLTHGNLLILVQLLELKNFKQLHHGIMLEEKISFMARAEYDYNEKYLASFTIRRDGSTSFGQNNKFGFFPSASLGWVMSNEDFLNLKL